MTTPRPSRLLPQRPPSPQGEQLCLCPPSDSSSLGFKGCPFLPPVSDNCWV